MGGGIGIDYSAFTFVCAFLRGEGNNFLFAELAGVTDRIHQWDSFVRYKATDGAHKGGIRGGRG